ncbi:zinc chelation protein SecC [Leucobacter rhizosphaerae]|uniref:Zinc chelation protein SecC n=1 Tax=Leucobacter rhizosphaerae TaxID=2932245 RepID=A0ABY4FWC5_9MICO|nr:YchJ family metal-binding protein [Leucobacter rhizosphaerae]UOQ60618.1 zinc chelation protein SecC [Leucobacter rhizosphaerae]
MAFETPGALDPCPCGRGVAFGACCDPLHRGEPAPTAERLMRSRYAAFVVGDAPYLLRSWDPATRPATMELDPTLTWKRLIVERAVAGGPFDERGEVTFTAVARSAEGRLEQRERSRFARSAGSWVYVDGDPL